MKKKAAVIAIGILLAVLIILAGIIVFLLANRNNGLEDNGVYVMDEGNYTQIQEEMANRVDEGYFETYMNTEWTFSDGAALTEDAILGNSPNNTKPIRCEILLSDTSEVVFTTGVIPVGAQLPPFKLNADLDAGKYDAVCMVYLLDELSDGTYQDYSGAGFSITIIIEN